MGYGGIKSTVELSPILQILKLIISCDHITDFKVHHTPLYSTFKILIHPSLYNILLSVDIFKNQGLKESHYLILKYIYVQSFIPFGDVTKGRDNLERKDRHRHINTHRMKENNRG